MITIEKSRDLARMTFDKDEICFKKYLESIEPIIEELLFNPMDDWRWVESNITQMVMITRGVFKGKIDILKFTEDPFFLWEKDDWGLIKFLTKNYSIDWIKIANIKRIKNTIKLSTEQNNLLLSLNGEKTKVTLEIDGVKTDELIVKTKRKYLFSWDEIPGSDNITLIEFLKKKFGIDGAKSIEIKKIDDGKTIQVSTGNNFSLTLNIEKTKLIIKIENGRTYEFIVKTENGKLYDENKLKVIYREGSNKPSDEEINNLELFQEIKIHWGFTKKIDFLHKNGILRDCSYRVLEEANEVRNKIHDPNFVERFSEQDLKLFSDAHAITYNLWKATKGGFGETYSTKLKSDVEIFAKDCLLKLKLK